VIGADRTAPEVQRRGTRGYAQGTVDPDDGALLLDAYVIRGEGFMNRRCGLRVG
jgi:hypothetical protein